MKDKNIYNYNSKKQLHGYQEKYWNNILRFRGNYKNGLRIGYLEWHYDKETEYYII